MKKHKLSIIGTAVRAMTHDVAFQFRMGAGFAGDVNRTHPAAIEAALVDGNSPPTIYGQALLIDATTQGVRPFGVADQSDATPAVAFGALVRPFPTQAPAGSSNSAQGLGNATPPSSGAVDVLRSGLIMVKLNTGVTAPVKGGRVYVWCLATSGNHVQGGYETEASAGNTVELDPRFTYNGGVDSNGVAELSFNV